MLTLLDRPYLATWDNHNDTKGDPYIVIGFQVYPDKSLHPVLINPINGRLLVVGLYDIQVDVKGSNLCEGPVVKPPPTPMPSGGRPQPTGGERRH